MNIDNYRFGLISIAGQEYRSDVVVASDTVKCGWRRKEGHSLSIEDLEGVIDPGVKILVVGTGYYGRMQVPPRTRQYVESQGIELRVANTTDAVEQFNALQKHCAAVVAALHLTC